MQAPTIEGLSPTTATKVVLALQHQGYQFYEPAPRHPRLEDALRRGGGKTIGYGPDGGMLFFLVRPPGPDYPDGPEFGVSLYVTSHGYLALLSPDAAEVFKRIDPQFTDEKLELVFHSGGGCFAFSNDCAEGLVAVDIHWNLQELDLTDLEKQVRFISHDHGPLRDGPCNACEARSAGAQAVTCPACGGSGEPQRDGDIDCWQCGGNHNVVCIFVEA